MWPFPMRNEDAKVRLALQTCRVDNIRVRSPTNMDPQDVPGHITDREGRWLAHTARDALAIEVGSFRGRSTCYIARTASHVIACEPFCGQGKIRSDQTAADFEQVRADWHRHTKACGVSSKICLIECTSSDAYPLLRLKFLREAQLVFIDGSHYMPALLTDACFSNFTGHGGIIAFHDYGDSRYPDVRKVVDDWSRFVHGAFVPLNAPGSMVAFRRVGQLFVPMNWFDRAAQRLSKQRGHYKP